MEAIIKAMWIAGGKHALKKKSLFIAPMKRELLYGNKYYLDLKVPLKFF
jgi:hypothetical protein